MADSAADLQQRVKAQLEVGEFGPAMETAQSAPTEAAQADLMKMVVRAQLEAGEFDDAMASIRRLPTAEARGRARLAHNTHRSLAGGSSGADFESLKSLIQSETTGPWEDVEGTGGTMTEYETGVRVDPNGLLARLTRQELTTRLAEMGVQARQAELNKDIARPSSLRLVSLTRLEKEVARRLRHGQPIVETMRLLAGLSRIEYVFVYPEANEVVIAGPAEGWRYNENGLPVGIVNGRPIMQLDDLVTVLRTFSPTGEQIFGCSINPRQEGLAQVKDFVQRSNSRGPLRPTAVRNWVKQLESMLGLQDIELYGVPRDSRVARVIVEADYRMKLIGIDKLDAGSQIPSYFDLLTVEEQKSSRMDALRWMLSVNCDAILHSADHNVFEIQDSSVLCKPENQIVTDAGNRIQTGQAQPTNQLFADNFTAHYDDLAQRDPVFADLQNIFDLAMVSALLRNERVLDRTGWDLGVFAPGGLYQPAQYQPAKVVHTVANHRVYRGRDIVVQVAGGVRADLMSLVRNHSVMQLTANLGSLLSKTRASELPEGRWWWDATK